MLRRGVGEKGRTVGPPEGSLIPLATKSRDGSNFNKKNLGLACSPEKGDWKLVTRQLPKGKEKSLKIKTERQKGGTKRKLRLGGGIFLYSGRVEKDLMGKGKAPICAGGRRQGEKRNKREARPSIRPLLSHVSKSAALLRT